MRDKNKTGDGETDLRGMIKRATYVIYILAKPQMGESQFSAKYLKNIKIKEDKECYKAV